ncbi:hypothetical protein OIU84_014327 [Salix udensis]|uniref:Uncharacterized protein n=1 Tax=Salix udensis TaxID=889485 RepID=A0AAD6JCM7_9ROSI|nr:hypothetical protein OIU84_014327 [Salix udensis]
MLAAGHNVTILHFVHAIAVPDFNMLKRSEKKRAVASGDGVADVIKSQLAGIRSKGYTKGRKGSSSSSKGGIAAAGTGIIDPARNRLHLDYSVDGKVAAVAGVTFSIFGEEGEADNFCWK